MQPLDGEAAEGVAAVVSRSEGSRKLAESLAAEIDRCEREGVSEVVAYQDGRRFVFTVPMLERLLSIELELLARNN